jgi:hypothetical protein
MSTTISFSELIRFDAYRIARGEIWRAVTWVATAWGISNPISFAISLYFTYFIGSTLEHIWGAAKFNVYYLLGVAFHIAYGMAVWFIFGARVPMDAGFLNMSMFFAFAAYMPEQRVTLFFVLPVKVKWLALAGGAYYIYNFGVMVYARQYALAATAIVGLLNFIIICGERLARLVGSGARGGAINFKRAARRARRAAPQAPYRHKCEVCGRTDAQYPQLEFRYCSRHDGYHCFCVDHINGSPDK